jgi:hypothetical protein
MKYKELIEANGLTLHGDIEHFAELVEAVARTDEREECAKISDDVDGYSRFVNQFISKRIRERGTT